jgi:asparagine synthase (glutamine-hydrolysing)
MARQLMHRGPDDEGIVVHGDAGLAHRRLATIGRADGQQPMCSGDGRYVIAQDGVIYNYRQLREELAGLGHRFGTSGDTEVLLNAWRQWGAEAFDRCNGGFAVAILDTHSGEMLLARDQFGSKPLYYAADGSGRVAFGSELRAVLAAGVVPRRPDEITLHRYLCLRALDDTERTFFDRVSRVLPGELAVITTDGQVHRQRYTRLYHELAWLAATPRRYDEAASDQLQAELQAAIRRRLVSEVPVGTSLASGLASATVVTTVDRLLQLQDPQAAAVGHEQQVFTTVAPASRGADQRYLAGCTDRLQVHQARPQPQRLSTDLVDFVRTQEEPVLTTGPYAQYYLMRQASQQVTVLLDGQGTDEALADTAPYLLINLRQLHRVRGPLPAAAELVRSADQLWRLGRRLAGQLRQPLVPMVGLLAADFTALHAARQRLGVTGDDLKQRLATDLLRHRLPALLRYQDRNAMRFSVQPRVPFLDQQLLRLLWSLDSTALVDSRALRDAAAGLLPPAGRQRPGWAAASRDEAWFAPLRPLAREVFSCASFGARPYFDQPAVSAAFASYLDTGCRTGSMPFWRLLNMELWLQELIDRDPTRPPETTFVGHYAGVGGPIPVPAGQGVEPGPAPDADAVPAGSAAQQPAAHQRENLVDLTQPQ